MTDTLIDQLPDAAGTETVLIPTGKIDPSPFNPRRHFDGAELAKLAASLKTDGQLQNCVVRVKKHRYELIAGERRWRAAKLAKVELRCVVLDVDDAKAIELSGMENYQRAQLNAVEEAAWFKAMIDQAGYTQASLAERLGITQGLVSQRLGLLALPENWQKRLITGVMPATWARELVPWASRPAVLDALNAKWRGDDPPESLQRLKRLLADAVEVSSRPVSGWFGFNDPKTSTWRHGDVSFKPTGAQLEQLDVIEVALQPGCRKERLAFNVPLWEELQAAGESRRAERETKQQERLDRKAASGKTSVDRAAGRTIAAAQFAKRLYRWKINWLQQQIATKLDGVDDTLLMRLLLHFTVQDSRARAMGDLVNAIKSAGSKGKLSRRRVHRGYYNIDLFPALKQVESQSVKSVAITALKQWILHNVDSYRSDLTAADVEAIADAVGVNIVKDWKLTRDFLELHTTAQLERLAGEWKLLPISAKKRNEWIVSILDHDKPKKCPAELVNVKEPKR